MATGPGTEPDIRAGYCTSPPANGDLIGAIAEIAAAGAILALCVEADETIGGWFAINLPPVLGCGTCEVTSRTTAAIPEYSLETTAASAKRRTKAEERSAA